MTNHWTIAYILYFRLIFVSWLVDTIAPCKDRLRGKVEWSHVGHPPPENQESGWRRATYQQLTRGELVPAENSAYKYYIKESYSGPFSTLSFTLARDKVMWSSHLSLDVRGDGEGVLALQDPLEDTPETEETNKSELVTQAPHFLLWVNHLWPGPERDLWDTWCLHGLFLAECKGTHPCSLCYKFKTKLAFLQVHLAPFPSPWKLHQCTLLVKWDSCPEVMIASLNDGNSMKPA